MSFIWNKSKLLAAAFIIIGPPNILFPVALALILPEAVICLISKSPLALILPDADIWPTPEPDIDKFPVNVCLSSDELPNMVEPLSNNIEDEINSVWNSWAVIVPVTVKSPSSVSVVFKR